MISISSSVGVYYAVRRHKQKKFLIEISERQGYKTSQDLMEEIKQETPFLKNYIDSDYQYKEVPEISDYIFSRFTSKELQKLDLLEFSQQEKKIFISEIINLESKERKQLFDEMLRNQEDI